MLKEHLQKLVYEFITVHQLHHPGEWRADLEPLKKVFSFRPLEKSNPARAFSLRPDPERDPNGQIAIYINDGLTDDERRMAIAHEASHAILGHNGSHTLYRIAPYFHVKEEQEAWQAAAILLIPEHAIAESPHVRWLERVCSVPAWLINEYPHVQRAFSLPMQTRPSMFR